MLRILLIIIVASACSVVQAQSGRNLVRKGNQLYDDKKYTESETAYRNALTKDKELFQGQFNLANALIKQKKYPEAIEQLQVLAGTNTDKKQLSDVYYNLGNAYFESQKFAESVDAYKMALINNPNDDSARYNLAYAQALLKKQQQENKNQDNNNKNEKNIPSEFAKKLKVQAEKLVDEGKLIDAYKLMIDGKAKDKTVAAFDDFINRIDEVIKALKL